VEFDETSFAGGVDQPESVDAEPLHHRKAEGTAPIDPRPPCPDCGAREAQIRTITRRRPTLFGPVEYVDHSEDFFECAGCGKLREDCYPDDPEPDDPEPEIRGFGN
jgi:hypothetical protein